MADRRHDASHPLQVIPIGGLGLLALLQLTSGPSVSRVVLSMPGWSQASFAGVLLAGAVATLWSTRGEGVRYARMELGGLLGCSAALLVYTLSVPGSVGSLSLAWFFGITGIGCAFRLGVVWRWLQRRREAQQ